MKKTIIVILILSSLAIFSCVNYSSEWENIYEKPSIEEFVGEWKIIEPTYKNLEEDSGLSMERNGRLIIKKDSTFNFKSMPAVIDFLDRYSPVYYFDANGTCSFTKGQGYWRLNLRIKKDKEFPEGGGVVFLIRKNKQNSLLRLSHMRLDESFIVFEKVQ